VVTLHEAVTRRQYERRIAQIQRDVLRLEGAAVRDLSRFLDTLRAQTLADLALVPQDGGWPAHRLSVLLTEIDEARTDLQQRLTVTLNGASRAAWEIGRTAQLQALTGSAPTPEALLGLDRLLVQQAVIADLAARIAADFRARARREIVLAVTGVQAAGRAIQQIGALFSTRRTAPGPIARQIVQVTATEVQAAYSLGDEDGTAALRTTEPRVRKWWNSQRDSRVRPAHVAAERRYQPGGTEGPIPLGTDFVVGGEKAKGPHDPRLSAANRVRCRCVRMVWSPEWGT